MIGASANIVAAGICAERVTFAIFIRYGLPITALQLLVGGFYFRALSVFAAGPGRHPVCD
jgi:Na+/H+ antiporter NhaD/arsenite permease-like protein